MSRKLLLLLLGGVGAFLWQKRPRQVQTNLRNRVVVVTGASAGIGRHTALAFAEHGAKVVLVARREEKLNAVADEIAEKYGTPTLVVPADLSLEKDIRLVVDQSVETFGQIDVLVNNAAMFLGGPLEQANPSTVRKLLAVNVVGVIRLTQAVLPGMLQRGSGHIVHVSSMVSLLGAPGASVYAASKIASNGFVTALRRELRGTGINLTNHMPGWTQTDMIKSMDRDEMRAAGILNPFIYIDPPQVVAKSIVDSVRYKRDEVLFGGPFVTISAWFARMFPGLYDFYYKHIADTAGIMETLRTPEQS